MDCLLPWLILINCLIIQGNQFKTFLEWNVIGKVTEYGQNVTLFCYVSNCCLYPAGWDMHIPQQRTIFIDVKTSRPDRKYDGKVLKDGYTLVIQSLTKDDLNIRYSCVYGGTFSYGKFLLERDVFKYKTTKPQVLDAFTYGESTSTSVQDKTTIPQVVDASTNGESTDNIVQDATTSPRNLGATSNVEDIINSAQGLLTREVIVYTVSLLFVMVFGIGFCFVSYKYTAFKKQRKPTSRFIPLQTSATPQNSQTIEMDHRLYEIIDEIAMLDDQQVQQMEISSDYLTVIDDSNKRESGEMKRLENHKNPCNLMSTAQTRIQENKLECLSLMRGDSTSSSDEFQQDSTQDYLNPYQTMIESEMLPPEVSEYLTLAPDYNDDITSSADQFIQDSTQDYINPYQSMIQSEMSLPEDSEYLTLAPDNSRIDSGMSNHQKNQKKNSLQHLRNVEKNAIAKTYENVLDVTYPSARPI